MKDNVKSTVVAHGTWLKYFQDLWSQTAQSLKVTFSLNSRTESITVGEFVTVFRRLKSNKAPGEDLIQLEFLNMQVRSS
jgi:hypothetical protein